MPKDSQKSAKSFQDFCSKEGQNNWASSYFIYFDNLTALTNKTIPIKFLAFSPTPLGSGQRLCSFSIVLVYHHVVYAFQ